MFSFLKSECQLNIRSWPHQIWKYFFNKLIIWPPRGTFLNKKKPTFFIFLKILLGAMWHMFYIQFFKLFSILSIFFYFFASVFLKQWKILIFFPLGACGTFFLYSLFEALFDSEHIFPKNFGLQGPFFEKKIKILILLWPELFHGNTSFTWQLNWSSSFKFLFRFPWDMVQSSDENISLNLFYLAIFNFQTARAVWPQLCW